MSSTVHVANPYDRSYIQRMNLRDTSRRSFLQQLGLGSSLLLVDHPSDADPLKTFPSELYPTLKSFQNSEGDYLVRIGVRCKQVVSSGINGRVSLKNAEFKRGSHYFMSVEKWQLESDYVAWHMPGLTAYPYVVVCCIAPGVELPELTIQLDKEIKITVAELFDQQGLAYDTETLQVSIGLLGTQEIGSVDPSFFDRVANRSDFQFAVMADPQGGNPEDITNGSLTRMKIHNAFIENSVSLVSLLDEPAFCLVLGDIVDSQGQETNFNHMLSYFRVAEDVPWLFSVGNHETKYQLTFGADYDFSGFSNYLAAQKQINGMDKLLYSFNLGKWHFIVWPDPLRQNFWETHPHYFDWLERDLERHQDQPTFFLQHIPVHPIGINPLINYAESVEVKRTLLNILAQWGNVKYVLSGHVHIPLVASLKTAVTYQGMNLINLPAAGFRPRAFGEEDITGGPVQGIAVVTINEEAAQVAFHTVTDEVYDYPTTFREFSSDEYPLWLKHKWELPRSQKIRNGNFSKGLTDWHCRYVYQEERNPSNICEVHSLSGNSAIYLYSASRGYRVPGQDRLPQTINRLCQAVSTEPDQPPVLSFHYQVDRDYAQPEEWAGAFVWVEGFEADLKKLDLVYAINKAYGNLRDNHRGVNVPRTHYFTLPLNLDTPNRVSLNISGDYEHAEGSDFSDLRLDCLIINLGVWTANEKPSQRMGVYFTDFSLDRSDAGESAIDGQAVHATASENIWRKGIDHIAGEHINVEERYVPPRRS